MADELAKGLMMDHALLVTRRNSYDMYLEDIKEFVRPASPDFYNSGGTISQPATNIRCYDSTAMWAAEQLAAGYAGFLTPSNDRWADLIFENEQEATRDEQLWLDAASDILYRMWANPAARFTGSMQENYFDLAGFGTSHVYQDWNAKKQAFRFRAYSPADCWIRENNDGFIDTLHRSTVYTTRQLYQQFDHGVLTGIEQVFKDKEKNERTFEVIHIVRPASDDDKLPTKKAYASFYILKASNDTLRKGGYDYFPYHTGREKVIAGHVYGQSSAFTMLPAIKMLNAMMKTVIKAANKAIDPPTMAPSDGFMVPLSADAGALWWYDAGMMNPDAVKQFPAQGRFEISDGLIEDVRNQITRGFKVDWLIRNKKNERQTATEIMDDRDEMLRQLAPTLGRIETEQISSIVKTSYNIARREGKLPPAPSSMTNKRLDVRFQSPLARAQYGARGADIQRYIADITPMYNIWPSMAQTIDEDALSTYLARIRNVPSVVLRDEKAKAELREAEAQQAQEQKMMEAAPALSRSLKDVAQAEEISGGQLT